jgi:hypothetical protein
MMTVKVYNASTLIFSKLFVWIESIWPCDFTCQKCVFKEIAESILSRSAFEKKLQFENVEKYTFSNRK